MKLASAILGVFVAVLLVAFLYEQRHARKIESAVVMLRKEREAMTAQLQKLDQRVAELQKKTLTSAAPGDVAARGEGAKPAAATLTAEAVARPGVTVTAPAGWWKNGSKPGAYVVGVDSLQTWGGMPSAYVKSLESSVDGFGGMMQTSSADDYVGKRVRMSGWIKTEDANSGGGHLWLRVDGQAKGEMLQFDNMNNRAAKGTTDWQEASVVLDVPAGATALAYGFFVEGAGTMWVSGTKIEQVGTDVPSTNMTQSRSLPKAPTNLGFNPNAPKG